MYPDNYNVIIDNVNIVISINSIKLNYNLYSLNITIRIKSIKLLEINKNIDNVNLKHCQCKSDSNNICLVFEEITRLLAACTDQRINSSTPASQSLPV